MMKVSFEGNVNEVLSDMKAFLQQSSELSPDVGAMTSELHPNMDAAPTVSPAPQAAPSSSVSAVEKTTHAPTTETPATVQAPSTPAPETPSTPDPATPEPPVATVPTAPAKEYSLDELLTATAPLMDAGKIADLQALMQKYGVASMMEIPKEKYGELATDLRALGAKL